MIASGDIPCWGHGVALMNSKDDMGDGGVWRARLSQGIEDCHTAAREEKSQTRAGYVPSPAGCSPCRLEAVCCVVTQRFAEQAPPVPGCAPLSAEGLLIRRCCRMSKATSGCSVDRYSRQHDLHPLNSSGTGRHESGYGTEESVRHAAEVGRRWELSNMVPVTVRFDSRLPSRCGKQVWSLEKQAIDRRCPTSTAKGPGPTNEYDRELWFADLRRQSLGWKLIERGCVPTLNSNDPTYRADLQHRGRSLRTELTIDEPRR